MFIPNQSVIGNSCHTLVFDVLRWGRVDQTDVHWVSPITRKRLEVQQNALSVPHKRKM